MTKKNNFILLCIFYILGCSPTIKNTIGKYDSTCRMQVFTDVILILYENHKFRYEFPFNIEVEGKWTLENDTLFLTSKDFNIPGDMILRKNTNYSLEMDAYIIKKDRLYELDSTKSIVNSCYLIKRR